MYEYYCLQQILKMLLDEDFVIRDANNDIRCIEYKVGDNKYKNEVDVANTYVLYRNDEKVVVYYQPVIYSDGYSNGLNLYRTTKKNSYYSPDFVLKFSRGKDEKYVVLDSKYANRNSIIKYRLRECIWNYGVEVEAHEETAGVEMMWLLQGESMILLLYTLYRIHPMHRSVNILDHMESYLLILKIIIGKDFGMKY